MLGSLPKSLLVNGKEHPIDSDFRNILTIMEAFSDPNLNMQERAYVLLHRIYDDLSAIPEDDLQEAYKQAALFIDAGAKPKDGPQPKLMDWQQDESLLFPAVNKVAGFETRATEYLHWWTFVGYFMEINEGVYSQVLSLRQKRAKGKKLEKWELEYWNANKDICRIENKKSDEQLAEIAAIEALLNGGGDDGS